MNLVKWLRKNNKKIMAVVVIGILFIFIGGGTFIKTLQSKQNNKRLGTYANGRKLTRMDLQRANQDLEILGSLHMEQVMPSLQGVQGLLLGELLFGEKRPRPELAEYATQMIRQNQYRIADADLTKIYEGKQLPSVYWFLLKREAETAGIAVPLEQIKQLLAQQIIPQLYQGGNYTQFMSSLLSRFSLAEKDVLQTVADLLAILQYAQLVCAAEDTTPLEARHLASRDDEVLDVNYVRLDGKRLARLVDGNDVITDAALQDQFDRHKDFLPGSVTPENPHGFGYRLPPRIQIDYMVVDLSNVQSLTPTQEETEDFYRRYVDTLYTSEKPTDPNDPNSPKIKLVQGYAEVADNVAKRLAAEKVLAQAETLLQEAKSLADLPLIGDAAENMTNEERRTKAPAYTEIAATLSVKYGIPIHTGRTGLLSMEEMNQDLHLRRLSISGRMRYPIPLAQILFTIDPINMVDLKTMTLIRPRLYESVGPLKDLYIQYRPMNIEGLTMALVRVTRVEVAQAPASLSTQYDRTGVRLASADPNAPRNTFTVRALVEQDLKTLAGFQRAQAEGDRFLKTIQAQGWEPALAELNRSLGEQLKDSPRDPNVFTLKNDKDLRRTQTSQLYMLEKAGQRNPMALSQYRDTLARSLLGQRLYDMIPPQTDRLNEPRLVTFACDSSVYCVKDLSVQRLTQETYEDSRGIYFLREDFIQGQSLALEHFRPDHIVQRNGFAWDDTRKTPEDANAPQP